MVVMEVDVLRDGNTIANSVTTKTMMVEVQSIARSYVVSRVSDSAVEIAVPTFIGNVVVSPDEPLFPYEGQIWIDIS